MNIRYLFTNNLSTSINLLFLEQIGYLSVAACIPATNITSISRSGNHWGISCMESSALPLGYNNHCTVLRFTDSNRH